MSGIKEIARLANVSTGTVSRYLAGHKLKKENTEKVEKAITALDYTVNYSARALRNRKSNTVGVAVYDFSGEYSGAIADAVSNFCEQKNYIVLVSAYHGDGDVQDEKMVKLKKRFIDGLIYYASGHKVKFLQEFHDLGIPVVCVNEIPEGEKCDSVRYDGYKYFKIATKYLIERGHKNIVFFAGNNFGVYAMETMTGYRDAMSESGLDSFIDVRYCCFSYEISYKKMQELLREGKATAVIAINDFILQGIIDAVNDAGVKPGEDISIIGCYSTKYYGDKSITHLKIDGQVIGEVAAEMLFKRIAFPNKEYENVKLDMEFVERSSVKTIKQED